MPLSLVLLIRRGRMEHRFSGHLREPHGTFRHDPIFIYIYIYIYTHTQRMQMLPTHHGKLCLFQKGQVIIGYRLLLRCS